MRFSLQTRCTRRFRQLWYAARRERLYSELAEEMETHARMKEQDHRRTGIAPSTARELVRRELGNLTVAKEDCWNMWSFFGLEQIAQDVRYAARSFYKTPVFTAVALLSLALGIGSNAAMFSLIDAILLCPLPYAQPDRLVRITGIFPRAALSFFTENGRAFDVAAASAGTEANLTGLGQSGRVVMSFISTDLLAVLGTPVERGRSFNPSENKPGQDGLIIISHALWRDRFSSDGNVIGRSVILNGVTREIVGIMPDQFAYPSSKVQAWAPMRLDPANFLEYWAGEFVPLVARLRPPATQAMAQGEMRSLVVRFRKTFPYPMARDWNADSAVIPLQDDLVGDVRGKLMVLLASVGIVLLIASANVSNLLLSRASTRRREIALRSALGAGRVRIIRQLLTESLALSFAGAVLGILLGTVALSSFKAVLPSSTAGLASVAMNWRVVVAVTALSLLNGILFGLAPALNASQIHLTETMKTGSQRSISGFWASFRRALIAIEVGMTLVLVVSAGLLLKSLYRLSITDPGFNSARILAIRVSPDRSVCPNRSACVAFYNKILKQAQATNGIEHAAVSNSVPLDGRVPTIPIDVEGHPKTADHPAPMLWLGAVTPGYLEMLRVPLLAGRTLKQFDSATAANAVVISASTAKRLWPGEHAIGKHIKPAGSNHWRTVVGITADVHQYALNHALPSWVHGIAYMPYAQSETEDGTIPTAMTLVVKVNGNVERTAGDLRAIIASASLNTPVEQATPLADIVTTSVADFRATIGVFLTFALGALGLAAIGIYGLMSYWVTQRTYEIGLRVALGATRRMIVAMILSQGLTVAAYGVVGGVIAALLLTRFLGTLLYGVEASDFLTFGGTIVIVIAVASLATMAPAWAASRVDPVKSLRAE